MMRPFPEHPARAKVEHLHNSVDLISQQVVVSCLDDKKSSVYKGTGSSFTSSSEKYRPFSKEGMINTGDNKRRSMERNTMSFSRRRRQHLSSTRMNQVEVQGESYLCFSQDHSWFQGNISTDDESNYSVYGEKVLGSGTPSSGIQLPLSSTATTPNESEDEVESDTHTQSDKTSDSYRMVLTDHFTGLCYVLNNIGLNPKAAQNMQVSLLNSPEAQIQFRVEQVHKGQKADMVIQRSLGSTSSLLGRKCLVYSGFMDIVFTDYEGMESGRSWTS